MLVLVTAEEPPPPVAAAQATAAHAVPDFTVVSKVKNPSSRVYLVIMFAGREREVSMYGMGNCYDTPIGAVLPRRCR